MSRSFPWPLHTLAQNVHYTEVPWDKIGGEQGESNAGKGTEGGIQTLMLHFPRGDPLF